jgi:predicted Zn finger-like uncharacterized protein
MKITCQSCQAKYTIADEKVLGKVVKIRCKKCGSTIVVNGSDPTAAAGSAELGQGAAEGWTVNVAEGDQRTMTDEEVVTAYRARVIDNETYCWKDGMGDWAPLREIPTLFEACTGNLGSAPRTADAPGAASDANGSAGAPAPTAARRAGGRAVAADLFGTAAQAGSEEDVMTSAPTKMPQAHEDAQKLTGARNENSVLFSLNTLTGKSDPPPPPNSEASGLIDIRQLSAQFGTVDDAKNKRKNSRVDDIMNLSGGGAFLPTLTAPALAPPSPMDVGSSGASGKPSSASSGKSRALILLAVGGGVLVILAAIGGAVSLMRGKGDETAGKDRPASSVSSAAAASGEGEPSAPPGASGSAAQAPVASASAAPSASANAAPPDTAPPATAAPTPTKVAAQTVTPHETTAAPPKAAAAAESDQPFNMGEAKARLAAVAGAVQSCKKASGPTGTGRVVVVFAPSGAAQSATVTGEPFEGTPTGGCVSAHFRAVRVPAFGGSPFSVSKSFSIN